MRKFLLATGERGLGFQAVYGVPSITTAQDFEMLWFLSQRVGMVQTEEGKEQIQLHHAVDAMKQAELQQETKPIIIDPYTQTPAEMKHLLEHVSDRHKT